MDIKKICDTIKLVPRTLIDVGACHPQLETNRLDWFQRNGFNCILIEPNPRLFYCLNEGSDDKTFVDSWPNPPPPPYVIGGLKHLSNVHIHNVAIADENKRVKMYERNASTFLEGIKSPAKVNDGYVEKPEDCFEVDGFTIDKFDDGQIDVLCSDTEGSEWFCIKHLVSRPKVIVLETHGQGYRNPFMNEINHWIHANNYKVVGKSDQDTLYVRK